MINTGTYVKHSGKSYRFADEMTDELCGHLLLNINILIYAQQVTDSHPRI